MPLCRFQSFTLSGILIFMLDIRFIRKNADRVQEAAHQKGYQVDIAKLLQLDDQRKELQQQVDVLRTKRNENAGKMKGGKPDQAIIDEGKMIKVELAEREGYLNNISLEFEELIKKVPNMPHEGVPVGASEDENVEIRIVGDKTSFGFEPKNHFEIAESKGWLDKERASKVSGARFAYIKGDLVKLQWSMMRYALDVLTDQDIIRKIITDNGLEVNEKPFIPVLPPLMIRTEPYDQMDRLEPREDRYKIEGEELWLQGSAEHVLGSMHAGEIIDESELPIRYVGYATSFRKEAGSYGKDMEGMIRMHQFDKLEMESMSSPESSFDEHLLMIAIQEYLMQQLKLPYRVLEKCTADIGKPNAKGVDIDAWLPGQNRYRETHTADFMTDYQARRLQTRVRRSAGGKVELVHTNDATALSQRPMIAIIENYQTETGDVGVPEVLQPYMNSRKTI